MKYAHYEETTGKLLGWYDNELHVSIPIPNIEVSEEDWQVAIDNSYNFIDASTGTLSKKDFRTLDDIKTAQKALIKEAFSNAINGGFTCSNGITMDADLTDILALKSGYDLALALSKTTMDITDFYNTDHLGLTVDDVMQMIVELGVNFETLRVKKNTLRDQIDSATDISEVESIVW